MQALIDGKVIACEGDYYKLNDKGNLAVCYGPLEDGNWGEDSCDDFVFRDENYVFDDTKCVDFAHAMGMMAQGKVMRCLWSENQLRIRDGVLQGLYAGGWAALSKGELLEEDEMESMWMEVDE